MAKKILVFAILILFSMLVQGQEVLHEFSGNDGSNARGPLLSRGEYLFGVTFLGGPSGNGVIYRIKPDGSDFEVLHLFDSVNGRYPNYGGLVTDGIRFYGMGTQGGSSNSGILYTINFDGSAFQVLHHFEALSGYSPYGPPYCLGEYLYGLTIHGESTNEGVFYRVRKDGTDYQVLKSFEYKSVSTGSNPHHGLTYDGERFYFCNRWGGALGYGTLCTIKPDGSEFKVLHHFAGGTEDGSQPGYCTPILVSGYLYGVASEAGANNLGVIYKIKKDGTEYQVLHHCSGNPDDINPTRFSGNLKMYKGDLYGVSSYGGVNNYGAIYKLDTNGNEFEIIASFDGSDVRDSRTSPLIIDGYLYGTSFNGGSSNYGTLFRLKMPESSRGDISASISPAAAVNAGAKWRLSFQEGWRSSGAVATDVKPGIYKVVYKPLDGWTRPKAEQITVEAGGYVHVSGVYKQEEAESGTGYLKVILKPVGARKAEAKWTVVGSGTWHFSGEKIELPAGDVRVRFSRVKGYEKPGPAVIEIKRNAVAVVKKIYTKK